MARKLDLLEKIDETRANSVTPEKFEQIWGYSLDDHAGRMMDFIHKLEEDDKTTTNKSKSL